MKVKLNFEIRIDWGSQERIVWLHIFA
jgi:hypothetical protein